MTSPDISTSPDLVFSLPLIPENVSTEMQVEIPFATVVSESESGISGRKSMRNIPLRRYTLTINPENVQSVITIILASKGARFPVAIRDWSYGTATYIPCVFVDDSLVVTVVMDQVYKIEDLHLRQIPDAELADILDAWTWNGTAWVAA